MKYNMKIVLKNFSFLFNFLNKQGFSLGIILPEPKKRLFPTLNYLKC